jgi:hypothetical protein
VRENGIVRDRDNPDRHAVSLDDRFHREHGCRESRNRVPRAQFQHSGGSYYGHIFRLGAGQNTRA